MLWPWTFPFTALTLNFYSFIMSKCYKNWFYHINYFQILVKSLSRYWNIFVWKMVPVVLKSCQCVLETLSLHCIRSKNQCKTNTIIYCKKENSLNCRVMYYCNSILGSDRECVTVFFYLRLCLKCKEFFHSGLFYDGELWLMHLFLGQ